MSKTMGTRKLIPIHRCELYKPHTPLEMIGPAHLERFARFVQGPVRTGLHRSSGKLKRSAQSERFAQFVPFASFFRYSLLQADETSTQGL